MPELEDVVVYLCKNYPHKNELSKARLTKMVYLADWKSALDHHKQMTDIEWRFNHFGPYVEDVANAARISDTLEVVQTTNQYGGFKELIRLLRNDVNYPSLSDEDKKTLDFVIKLTAPKYWDDFIRTVYSTYPIMTQPRGATLDLSALAERYQSEQDLFEVDSLA